MPILVTTQREKTKRLLRQNLLSASDRFFIFYNGCNNFAPLRDTREWRHGGICQESQFMVVFQKRDGQNPNLHDEPKTDEDLPPNFFCAGVCHFCRFAKASTTCNKCKMIFYCGANIWKRIDPSIRSFARLFWAWIREVGRRLFLIICKKLIRNCGWRRNLIGWRRRDRNLGGNWETLRSRCSFFQKRASFVMRAIWAC